MFSRWRERLRHTLGFRLALWYAIVFVASSVAIVGLTYVLLAASLRQYDRETIQTTIVQFASAYARGGVDALAREIRTVQLASEQGPLFVRTLGSERDVLFLSMPDDWRQFDLSQLATPALSGEQTWATLADRQRRQRARSRIGTAARRHSLPGRQEHRPSRGAPAPISRRALRRSRLAPRDGARRRRAA